MPDGTWIPIVLFASIPAMAMSPIGRAIGRRIEGSSKGPQIPSDVSARLERMEQAIDSIAVEVERISEGQRFTTKLLSERVGSAAPVLGSPPQGGS